MNFNVLFTQCFALWPPTLDISDGVYSGAGFRSEHLAAAWDKAELAAELAGEWQALMTWILYKNLHAIAQERFARQTYTLTKEILLEYLTHIRVDFLDHLREPTYANMLAAYQRDNS